MISENLLNKDFTGKTDVQDKSLDGSAGQICDKNGELVKLLSNIVENVKEPISAQKVESHLIKFKEIYSGDFRHSYSHLTQYFCVDFYQKNQLDRLGLLVSYLKSLEQSNDKNESLVKNKLAKLIDHVELEYQRLNLMGEAKKELIELKNEAEKAKNELQDAKAKAEDAVKKADDAAKDIRKELITIVGILSAVLIGSVGSFIFGGKMFENISSAPLPKLTFGFLAVGTMFILFLNMLFSFLREVVGNNNTKSTKFWHNFIDEPTSTHCQILIFLLSIIFAIIAYLILDYFTPKTF